MQFHINNTPPKRLGGRIPNEVFLGTKDSGPLDFVDNEEYAIRKVKLNAKELEDSFENLKTVLEEMHSSVVDVQQELRMEQERKRSALNMDNLQYAIGNFVLVSRSTRKPDKLYP